MKYSIIIPVYNLADYIDECLQSVLAQTSSDWECVCVDDGSTDGSGDILEGYAERDSRIKVIHQKNAGVCVARNAALDRVSGEWVVFLDGDDLLTPGCLASYDSCISRRPDASLLLSGLELLPVGCVYGRKETDPIAECLEHDCRSEIPNCLWRGFSQYAYKRAQFANVRFLSGKQIGEDRLYLAECLSRSDWVVETSGVSYVYRQRDGSAMRSVIGPDKIADSICCDMNTVEAVAASKKNSGINDIIARSMLGFCCDGIVHCADPATRSRLLEMWYDALKMLVDSGKVTLGSRWRLRCLLVVKSRWAILVLAYWPYKLQWHYDSFKGKIKHVPVLGDVLKALLCK